MASSREINRDDLLLLLSSFGIVIQNSKISSDELNKKLGLAFDAAQQLDHLLPTTPIDPSTFPPWDFETNDDDGKSDQKNLFQATHRNSIFEMCGGDMSKPGKWASKEETFKEMRQSVLSIAYMLQFGVREISFIDENRLGFLLKVVDVRKINQDTPLFLFEIKENFQHTENESAIVRITDLERRALLKLFHRNTKKLQEASDSAGSRRSFVLPLCPLSMQTLGKLTSKIGCQVCGKNDTSRCMRCFSVHYCSRECQKIDWPEHQSACKSLQGAAWHTIKLTKFGGHATLINTRDALCSTAGSQIKVNNTSSSSSLFDEQKTPKGKIFLAKFQVPLVKESSVPMLVYDRQRSFNLAWMRSSDPKLFGEVLRITEGLLKFYAWCKVVSEHELEVCFDRRPANNPVW